MPLSQRSDRTFQQLRSQILVLIHQHGRQQIAIDLFQRQRHGIEALLLRQQECVDQGFSRRALVQPFPCESEMGLPRRVEIEVLAVAAAYGTMQARDWQERGPALARRQPSSRCQKRSPVRKTGNARRAAAPGAALPNRCPADAKFHWPARRVRSGSALAERAAAGSSALSLFLQEYAQEIASLHAR